MYGMSAAKMLNVAKVIEDSRSTEFGVARSYEIDSASVENFGHDDYRFVRVAVYYDSGEREYIVTDHGYTMLVAREKNATSS